MKRPSRLRSRSPADSLLHGTAQRVFVNRVTLLITAGGEVGARNEQGESRGAGFVERSSQRRVIGTPFAAPGALRPTKDRRSGRD